jgi:hypothetical protein
MARYLIDANLPRHLTVWNGEACVFVADIDPARNGTTYAPRIGDDGAGANYMNNEGVFLLSP